MIKFDENKNITEEYKNYISNLEREELEIIYIGADAYVDRLNNVLNELEKLTIGICENCYEDKQTARIKKYINELKESNK